MLFVNSSLQNTVKLYDSDVKLLANVIIEGIYVTDSDVPLLPAQYQNITGLWGHVCNRAKFVLTANDVNIGYINLNNSDGTGFIEEDNYNTPAPLTNNFWKGSYSARYSLISLTHELAQNIILNSTTFDVNDIRFKLIPLHSDPHTDITWLRISKINSIGQKEVVTDLLARLYTEYIVNINS